MNFDQRRDLVFRLILEKAPFFFLTAVFSSFTIFCHWKGGTVASFDKLPLEMRIGNALVSYITYISKMIWPNRLAVLYPYPISLPIWEVVGAALLLIIITVLVIFLWTETPLLCCGMAVVLWDPCASDWFGTGGTTGNGRSVYIPATDRFIDHRCLWASRYLSWLALPKNCPVYFRRFGAFGFYGHDHVTGKTLAK